ncbi:MAG: DUF4918 family protein [Chitinophagales bacterium]|nr:DUF4918 family protein [Chitinophagales bacterium]
MSKYLSEQILAFYTNLRVPERLPRGVEVLYPFADAAVQAVMQQFYAQYFHDTKERTLIFGINPGRHGAGITGINFTAPRQLLHDCGIQHTFGDSSELSAEFIYAMIQAYGGAEKFYQTFFISAVSPLGYVLKGKNLNYYDTPLLQRRLKPFIVDCIMQQIQWPVNRKRCICIGGDKNLRYLSDLNDQYQWFQEIDVLPHPRFIMQYKRKYLQDYIAQYLDVLTKIE